MLYNREKDGNKKMNFYSLIKKSRVPDIKRYYGNTVEHRNYGGGSCG